MKYIFLLFCLITGSSMTRGQADRKHADRFPEMISPVKHALRLAGTFGELRTNHFHTGIDIKSSNGQSGDFIFSVDEGFISRIKVQAGGYGQVLYIDHPNGYTSVYAHLDDFADDIQAYVRSQQYKKKRFEVDLYLSESTFPVRRGQYLGTMGTSGRAFGPHLHFEIRKTDTEVPINPMHFGLRPPDQLAPYIGLLAVYTRGEHGTRRMEELPVFHEKGAKYTLRNDTLAVQGTWVGFGIQAFDRMDAIPNKNGVYGQRISVDGEVVLETIFDVMSFSDFRKLNAFIDPEIKQRTKRTVGRLHRLPGLALPALETISDDGFIALDKTPKRIDISVFDFEGNEGKLQFWLRRNDQQTIDLPSRIYHHRLRWDTENMVTHGAVKLWIPEGALSEDLLLLLDRHEEATDGRPSISYHIGDDHVPLLQHIELSLPAYTIADSLRDKACVLHCDSKGKHTTYGGQFRHGGVTAKVKRLGTFALAIDTIPPTIKPVGWRTDWSKRTSVSFRITDNFETAGSASDLSYDAYLDDQWLLFSYDKKSDMIRYTFDDRLTKGRHDFRLIVRDDRGNETIFEAEITF